MAVINDPNDAALVARVGMRAGQAWKPLQVSLGHIPPGTGGVYRLAMSTGTIAAALAANAEIFQFRYVTANGRKCLVHSISVSAGAVAAATAAGHQQLKATIARNWTAAGSGGTRASLIGNLQKLDVNHATSEVADAGVSTTAALTAGTKTLDTQDIGSVSYGVGTGAITVSVPMVLVPKTYLFCQSDSGNSPLVLSHQEGFVVRNGLIMPATMTWGASIEVAWSEVQSFEN